VGGNLSLTRLNPSRNITGIDAGTLSDFETVT